MSQAVRKPCFPSPIPKGKNPRFADADDGDDGDDNDDGQEDDENDVAMTMAPKKQKKQYQNHAKRSFCPLGIELKKQGFRTAWDITGQTFQGLGLKLQAFILAFRDLAPDLYQKKLSVANAS